MSLLARALVFLGCIVLVVLPGSSRALDAGAGAAAVVLISMDGVPGDLLKQARTPVLDALAAAGARVERLVPPFPSNTFPSHASMATGTYPQKHGIVNNKFVDRRRGGFDRERPASWLRAEPLWATAERQGVRAGVIMWVTSEGDWRGVLPSFHMKYRRHTGDEEKVERILAWLSRPAEARPRLIMAWFQGTDREVHRFGPGSREARRRIEAEDRLLGRLLEGLERRGLRRSTTLLVVSDHGSIPLRRVVNLARALRAGGLGGVVATAGGLSHIYLDAPWEVERARQALSGHGEYTLYRREELPPEWKALAEARVGDLVAVAKPGVWFSEGPRAIAGDTPADRLGGHGYPPGVAGTDGFLIAAGPGIRPGARLPVAATVDIHPTLCWLLGIRPAEGVDGRTLDAILTPATRGGGSSSRRS
jgi:predicted AlkP superfamily pyrophosphatase or phosphodiesterase